MPERTIRTGVATYRGVDGRSRFGLMGAVVDVAADDVERFDRLNGAPAETERRKPGRPHKTDA